MKSSCIDIKLIKRQSKKDLMKSEILGLKSGMFNVLPPREEYIKKIDIERHGKYPKLASFIAYHNASRILAKKRLRTKYQELGAQFL